MSVEMQDLIAALRRGGLKVTPQRHLLCRVVAQTVDHPTVETVYQRAARHMPTLSLKTVYTTLTELAELGLIRLGTLGTHTMRVDADPHPHAHLVCRACGEVIDQPLPERAAPAAPRAAAIGFQVEAHEVIFRGLCAHCRTSSGN